MDSWLNCFVPERRVAICLPNPFGEPIALFWYGILASLAIFVGAWYASKHIQREGEDGDAIWDGLLWVLVPALLGARLWYVGQVVAGGGVAAQTYANNPLEVLNFRAGGMNIFGGIFFGLVAVIIYTRRVGLDTWLAADAGLLGALIGQAIGRIGNWINSPMPSTRPIETNRT